MLFLLFLAISAVLWIVMTLNEETQRDLRCEVAVTNVPDSLINVNNLPSYISVSVRSRGTSMMKYLFSDNLRLNIDYRNYASGNRLVLNDIALKAFFRSRFGSDVQILNVNPDSLNLYYASRLGTKVPLKVDAHVAPGPQYAIVGKVKALTDSVVLCSVDANSRKVRSVSTAPIVLNDVRTSQTLRVPVITPPNVRAVPDSVDVHIDVEQLVSKSRKVAVTPVNVPPGMKLITVPNQVEVYYMVPMSIYKQASSDPKFVVTANYNAISPQTDKVPVTLKSAPKDFINVFVDVDSVEYIVEQ